MARRPVNRRQGKRDAGTWIITGDDVRKSCARVRVESLRKLAASAQAGPRSHTARHHGVWRPKPPPATCRMANTTARTRTMMIPSSLTERGVLPATSPASSPSVS